MTRTLGRIAGGLIWLAIIVAIALGAAGIVTGMDHAPGTPARPDVTAAGDAEVTPMLDAAQADLSALAGQVEALGSQARGALAALNSLDPAGSDAAIADGDRLVADVIARTAALRHDLASVPYVGTPTAALTVSDAVVARHAALVAALDATDGLDAAWARLTIGSVAASRMSAALAEHDRLVVAATQDGRLAKYASAMKLLDKAEAQIAAARKERDGLVQTVDVSVLDQWLERNQAYDVALRNLYKEISKVGKKISPGDEGRGQGRGRRPRPPATGHPGPDHHHVRDRPGRDERRRHRHRGGAGQADRRDRRGDGHAERRPGAHRRRLTDSRRLTVRAPRARLHCVQHPAHRPVVRRTRGRAFAEDPHPCSFMSSPISRGTCPRMSSSCPSPPSRRSMASWPRSIAGPAASSPRSWRSAS